MPTNLSHQRPSTHRRPRRRPLARFALVLLAGLPACRADQPAPIVIISIDTLRSDHLPAYGYSGVATPALDALRRDGVLYEHAYSPVPLTFPAHTSLLSGRLPTEHGVRDNGGYRVTPDLAPWLPTLLRERGYATGGAVSAFVLRGAGGMARGFEVYDDAVPERHGLPLGGLARSGQASFEAVRPWLRTVAAGVRPFFLFFHLYEPHLPYQPPAPYAGQYSSAPYDGEIAEADRVVGELIAELKRLEVYDRAAIVLVSDHGEGLGEHGEDEHGVLLYRESLQVPLLLKLPENRLAGTTVSTPAQLTDVLPTLAEIAGFTLPADLGGDSLLSLPADRLLYAESYYGLHYGWQVLRSLIGDGHHWIESREPELYDLAGDPRETRNLVAAERRLGHQLRQGLATFSTPAQPPLAVNREARAALAALGYVSGTSATALADAESLPSPRGRIQVLRELATANALLRDGRTQEAVAKFTAILEREPLILDAWAQLGVAQHRLGRPELALSAHERAFELSGRQPDYALAVAEAKLVLGHNADAIALANWAQENGIFDFEMLAQLARRLLATGQFAEAERLLRGAASSSEPQRGGATVLAVLAELLASTGRADEAVTMAERAIALAPEYADAYEQLALAELTRGRFEPARQAAARAVALDPKRGNAWNHLGVALFQLGAKPDAIVAWMRAVEVNPALYDTLYNLGLHAAEVGQREQAVSALRRFLEQAPPARYGADFPRARAALAALQRSS